jgi:DNA-binding transcriptional MerR regulator
MKKLLSIGEAAKALGVTTTTMRNWDKNGILTVVTKQRDSCHERT